MIKKIQCGLLSNDKPQDKNVMWIDTSNSESFTLKLFRNGDWKPLHVVGTTRDMIERELTGYVTSHYHSYDKIINKPTTLTGYGITDCFNKTEIESLLNKKVTKVSGKSLSTNDFTNEEKNKLADLENYDDTKVRELIAGKANLQHQHTVADITDFPELYYDATAFFTSKIYPSDKYEELLEAVKAKKTVYAIIDEEGYVSYVFFTSSTNSDGLSSRVLLTTMFADGGYLYMNTFVLQQSGMTTLRENITGKANKATTLAGYGIRDAYTKSEVDNTLKGKQDIISDLDAIRSNAQKGNDASNILTDIVDAGYVFAGVATPTTNPDVPDTKVFYIAKGKGVYTNFGSIQVTEDDVVILYYDTAWHKVSTGIASQAKLSELEGKIEGKSERKYTFNDLETDGFYQIKSGECVPVINANEYFKGLYFNVSSGDKVIISTIGGTSAAKAWGVTDKNYKTLQREENDNADVTGENVKELTITEDGYVFVNFSLVYSPSHDLFYVNHSHKGRGGLVESVEQIKESLRSIDSDVSNISNDIYVGVRKNYEEGKKN